MEVEGEEGDVDEEPGVEEEGDVDEEPGVEEEGEDGLALEEEDEGEEGSEGEEEETLLEGFEEVGVELVLFWQPASVATVSSETTDRKRRFLFFIITPFSWNLMTKI